MSPYGNICPARLGGGISDWLPSHSELLWSHQRKWNKGGEARRILHPPSTKGVLQSRVRL